MHALKQPMTYPEPGTVSDIYQVFAKGTLSPVMPHTFHLLFLLALFRCQNSPLQFWVSCSDCLRDLVVIRAHILPGIRLNCRMALNSGFSPNASCMANTLAHELDSYTAAAAAASSSIGILMCCRIVLWCWRRCKHLLEDCNVVSR